MGNYIMGFPVLAVVEARQVRDKLSECSTEEEVLKAMTGVSIDAFRFLDEKPGYFGAYEREGWPMLLRRVRNDSNNNLFDRLVKFPTCQWFALCDNPATKTREHPVLGSVLICDRCDEKVEALS